MMSDTETVDTTETSWGYAISTDPVPLADAADAVARVINGYIDTANPADEVVDHLETAQKAVIDIPDAPEVSGDITAPVAVDGGSFSQIK